MHNLKWSFWNMWKMSLCCLHFSSAIWSAHIKHTKKCYFCIERERHLVVREWDIDIVSSLVDCLANLLFHTVELDDGDVKIAEKSQNQEAIGCTISSFNFLSVSFSCFNINSIINPFIIIIRQINEERNFLHCHHHRVHTQHN